VTENLRRINNVPYIGEPDDDGDIRWFPIGKANPDFDPQSAEDPSTNPRYIIIDESHPMPTQQKGSIVTPIDITTDIGTISAGNNNTITFRPSDLGGEYLYLSIWFRRNEGRIDKIELRHESDDTEAVSGFTIENLYLINQDYPAAIGVTDKIQILTDRFNLRFYADEQENDFVPEGIHIYLWRR